MSKIAWVQCSTANVGFSAFSVNCLVLLPADKNLDLYCRWSYSNSKRRNDCALVSWWCGFNLSASLKIYSLFIYFFTGICHQFIMNNTNILDQIRHVSPCFHQNRPETIRQNQIVWRWYLGFGKLWSPFLLFSYSTF